MRKQILRCLLTPIIAFAAISASGARNSSLQSRFQQRVNQCGLEGEKIVRVEGKKRVFYLDNIKLLRLTLSTPYYEHARAERISAAIPCITKAARNLGLTFIPPMKMQD